MSNTIDLPDYALERLERYRPLLGSDWDGFLAALRRPLPVAAWRNARRISQPELERWFTEVEPGAALESLPWFDLGYRIRDIGPDRPRPRSGHPQPGHPPQGHSPRPGNRLARALGLIHLQEEVSMIPAVLLDPQPGELVLDLCGAPGNKTALVASRMHGTGTVVCNDTDLKRLRAGRPAWTRLGLANITATNHDGGSFPGAHGSYDRVLVDAPCSGEGTSRRQVSSLRPGPPGYYRMLHGRQRRLLERALALCRPGGRVIYSTCTYAPEEDELVVADVLEQYRRRGRFQESGSHEQARHNGFDVELLPARIEGLSGSPGITEWHGRQLTPELSNTLRVWPHQNDSGGFFVAVLRKRARGAPAGAGGARSREGGARPGPSGGAKDSGDDPASRRPENNTPLGPACRPTDPAPYLSLLSTRFGMEPASLRDDYLFFVCGRKYLYYLSRDHRVPPGPEIVFGGIRFMRTSMKVPKLTTEAAVAHGELATKNTLVLDTAQAARFLARKSATLSQRQCSSCEGPGYVFVRYGGQTLGMGYLHGPESDAVAEARTASQTGEPYLESWFPKEWGEVVSIRS